jgi:sugar phosphate isomerase/epimerase
MVKGRDSRLGSASDTGHWIRSSIKPVDALKILKGRIISSHLKDLNIFGPDAHDVPYGTGVADIPAILRELKRQRFNGNISIEYEYNWTTSVPEIAQCIGFVRGFGAAMKY